MRVKWVQIGLSPVPANDVPNPPSPKTVLIFLQS
jgi:hypothetical protein